MRRRSGETTLTPRLEIGAHDRVFVLTGAGVSAESGLPTFRDSNGLWHGHRVEEVATPEAWKRDPRLVWNFYSERRKAALKATPNPAHLAVAALERRLDDRFFLCTQNVDDLHERAGSKRLAHIHGELFRTRCESCDLAPFKDSADYFDVVPRCECGARLRPDIVWFGEAVQQMDRVLRELDRCTILLVVGTSGVVQPAASFVEWASRKYLGGGPLVHPYYIGPEHPANASSFTRSFLGKAGEILPTLFA